MELGPSTSIEDRMSGLFTTEPSMQGLGAPRFRMWIAMTGRILSWRMIAFRGNSSAIDMTRLLKVKEATQ